MQNASLPAGRTQTPGCACIRCPGLVRELAARVWDGRVPSLDLTLSEQGRVTRRDEVEPFCVGIRLSSRIGLGSNTRKWTMDSACGAVAACMSENKPLRNVGRRNACEYAHRPYVRAIRMTRGNYTYRRPNPRWGPYLVYCVELLIICAASIR